MDLTEAEDIKKRWQEYTEELYKKDLHDPDNHDGVITHLRLKYTKAECDNPILGLTAAYSLKKREIANLNTFL